MKSILKISACIFLSGMLIFTSCKKDESCEGCKDNNKSPIANAGADQTITLPKDSVILDGSASSDPDGTITAYNWTKIAGPSSSNISKPDSSKTSVKTLVPGVYKFELTVTDNGGLFAKDTVQVMVDAPGNQPPVACAGADQVITLPTNSVTLDGSCSADPDNNIASYAWTKISGPAATITTATAAQTQVTGLVQGVYQFELKVTDAGGLFSKDTIQVTVNAAVLVACDNSNRPIINAQLIPVGTLPQTRGGMAVASASNKILFAGGSVSVNTPSTRVDIYDIAFNSWSTAELSIGRFYGIAAVASGSKVFFAGGQISDGTVPTDVVDVYDVTTNTWTANRLSLAGEDMATTTVGDKVFFAGGMGGFSGGNARSKRVDIYNLSTNTWTTAELSEYKIGGHNAVTVNNKVYIAGGVCSLWISSCVSNKIDIYDNITNAWSTATMQEAKSQFAGIVAGNKIYWGGGFTTGRTQTCSVEIKDVNAGSSIIQYLYRPTEWSHAIVKDNKIVFFGAHRNSTNANITYDFSKFDIYDIVTNTWSIGVMPINIRGASLIAVNNVIYIAGGVVNGALSSQVYKLEF